MEPYTNIGGMAVVNDELARMATVSERVEQSRQVSDLLDQRRALIAYMKSKITAEDWHAVQDSASDIREIDAKLSVLHA